MKLRELREQVCAANKMLPQSGLVILTWGNVSAFDQQTETMVIKPSGVPYDRLTPENMVLVNKNGEVVEGTLRPSSDMPTHLELYKFSSQMKSIVHTHSKWATIWAQMGLSIPPLGTTHADDFGEEIICTRNLSPEEIQADYEKNTGKVIIEALSQRNIKNHYAILVRNHGPFVWEATPEKAVKKAIVLEEVAMLAWHCCLYDPEYHAMSAELLHRHFQRKHGPNAYYGQDEEQTLCT